MVSAVRKKDNAPSTRTRSLPESSTQGSFSSSRQDDTIPETPNSDIGSMTEKCVRGPTRGIDLRKLNKKNKGKKLTIHIDPEKRRPTNGVESAKLSSELGLIARESLPVPTVWKNMKDAHLMEAFDRLQMNLTIPDQSDENKKNVWKILMSRSRYQRHVLNTHYKKFSSLEEAIRNKPAQKVNIDQENWELLCTTLFSDPKYQERCKKNQQNRLKMRTNHNQGSRSFVVARHMISQERNKELNQDIESDDDVEEIDRINFYKHTHYTEGKGWTTPESEKNHAEMVKRKTAAQIAGEEVDIDKIVDDILGRRSSYIVGLGHGPKPNKSNPSTRALQEALKEKESENTSLREQITSLQSTMDKYGPLLEKLSQSDRLNDLI